VAVVLNSSTCSNGGINVVNKSPRQSTETLKSHLLQQNTDRKQTVAKPLQCSEILAMMYHSSQQQSSPMTQQPTE